MEDTDRREGPDSVPDPTPGEDPPPLRATWTWHRGRQNSVTYAGPVQISAHRLGKKSDESYRWQATAYGSGFLRGDGVSPSENFRIQLQGYTDSEYGACLAAEAQAERVRVAALAMASTDAERAIFAEPCW